MREALDLFDSTRLGIAWLPEILEVIIAGTGARVSSFSYKACLEIWNLLLALKHALCKLITANIICFQNLSDLSILLLRIKQIVLAFSLQFLVQLCKVQIRAANLLTVPTLQIQMLLDIETPFITRLIKHRQIL